MHDILGTLNTFVLLIVIGTYLVRKEVWEMYLSFLRMDDFYLYRYSVCAASDLWLIEMYSSVFHLCLLNVVSKIINVLIWIYLVRMENVSSCIMFVRHWKLTRDVGIWLQKRFKKWVMQRVWISLWWSKQRYWKSIPFCLLPYLTFPTCSKVWQGAKTT